VKFLRATRQIQSTSGALIRHVSWPLPRARADVHTLPSFGECGLSSIPMRRMCVTQGSAPKHNGMIG